MIGLGGPREVSVGSLLVSNLLWVRDGVRIREICCASDVIDGALCMYNTDIPWMGSARYSMFREWLCLSRM